MIAFERPAHAYVDPGSGLLIFQIAGSMFTGAVFILRNKIKKLFRREPAGSEDASAESVSDTVNGHRS